MRTLLSPLYIATMPHDTTDTCTTFMHQRAADTVAYSATHQRLLSTKRLHHSSQLCVGRQPHSQGTRPPTISQEASWVQAEIPIAAQGVICGPCSAGTRAAYHGGRWASEQTRHARAKNLAKHVCW